jgi:hypothetical protein
MITARAISIQAAKRKTFCPTGNNLSMEIPAFTGWVDTISATSLIIFPYWN